MTEQSNNKNKILTRTLVMILEFLVLIIIAYLIIIPFWSAINYKYYYDENKQVDWQSQSAVEERTNATIKELDKKDNFLLIPKINVKVPIVKGDDADLSLAKGAWIIPAGSTPDKGANTIITGHRFKYLPPSNLTFYLLDKLEKDDYITVIWEQKEYLYQVQSIKIVKPADTSILKQDTDYILTLYTCNPLFSQKERLVVISNLVKITELDSVK